MGLFDGLLTTTYPTASAINSHHSGGNSSGFGGTRNSSSSDVNDYLNMLSSITDRNNSIAIQNAREQMGFQAQQALQAQKFNQMESEKTRLWQERMSNTAHQREVQDLIKAGLNPVLSSNLSGSSTPSGSTASSSGIPNGAMAQVDTSLASALVNLMSATINSSTAIKTTKYSSDMSAKSNVYGSTNNLLGSVMKSISSILPLLFI